MWEPKWIKPHEIGTESFPGYYLVASTTSSNPFFRQEVRLVRNSELKDKELGVKDSDYAVSYIYIYDLISNSISPDVRPIDYKPLILCVAESDGINLLLASEYYESWGSIENPFGNLKNIYDICGWIYLPPAPNVHDFDEVFDLSMYMDFVRGD